MRFLKPVPTVAIVSLLASPAYAQPGASARAASPSAEHERLFGGSMIPLIVLLAAVVVVAAVASGHNKHMPKSP